MNRYRLIWHVAAAVALTGCGQKGPLYLPEKTGEIVTRPTQTPAPAPAPAEGESTGAPDSPQNVDSPAGQTSPAERDEKKKKEAARPQ